jgi:hypothetical protein
VNGRLPAGAYPPGRTLRLGSGPSLTVGSLLAKGGQGYVYEVVQDRALVFKQIKPEALRGAPDHARRVAAMVAGGMDNRRNGAGHVLLTWPLDTVLDGGQFVGFVMPRIDASEAAELHIVSNPSDRRDPGPKTPGWVKGYTWRYLLRTATNLARATELLHKRGYVVGDFNDRNILVTSEARVTLIDCDSMQVPDSRGGVFLCEVGRPEFTAPELLRGGPGPGGRKPSSDLFPLAVHIHQLLLEGVHPFDGVWEGTGDKPKRPELARDGVYLYGGDPRLRPQPLSIDIDLVPPAVRDLFRRAFVSGAVDPELRPRGREWGDVLGATDAGLQTCRKVATHEYPGHLTTCPWCQLLIAVNGQKAAPAPSVQTPRPPVQTPLPPLWTPPHTAPATGLPPRVVVAPAPAPPPSRYSPPPAYQPAAGTGPPRPPMAPPRRSRAPLVLAISAALALGGVAYSNSRDDPSTTGGTPASSAPPGSAAGDSSSDAGSGASSTPSSPSSSGTARSSAKPARSAAPSPATKKAGGTGSASASTGGGRTGSTTSASSPSSRSAADDGLGGRVTPPPPPASSASGLSGSVDGGSAGGGGTADGLSGSTSSDGLSGTASP